MNRKAAENAFVRSDPFFGVLLFVLALTPRLFVAAAWTGEPVWDGHYYDFGAHRIAHGLGYSDDVIVDGHAVWHPWCHYPVGYSAYLAFFYKVFGEGPLVAPVVNAATGALLAVVTWLLARHAVTTWRARIAGLLVALHPGLILYSGLVMSEPLAALLTLVAFWLAVRNRPHPEGPEAARSRDAQVRGIIVGALVLGVAALVRPQALLCAPFLALLAPKPEGAPRSWMRAFVRHGAWMAVVGLMMLAPVLPWTARNCRVMDGCALVSTNAGWNLAIGAFPRATGRFETLRSSDGCREVTGQVQQDRCWFVYGMQSIAADPQKWLSLVPKKLGYTFDHESFPVEYLHEARPAAWPEPRRVRARELLSAFHRILVVAAALACVAFRPRGKGAWGQWVTLLALGLIAFVANANGVPTFWPLILFTCVVPLLPIPGRLPHAPAIRLAVAFLATTVVTHAVFFGEDRYHVVVSPVLCLLAAAALRKPGAPA